MAWVIAKTCASGKVPFNDERRDLHFALWFTRQRPGFYGTGHGFTFQISSAYSEMVRSVENLPELATFKMAFRVQPSGSLYKSSARWSASRYDFKSARCI